jgi:hypothetical protein
MYEKFVTWLNSHPFVKGLAVALEGAAWGVLVDAVANPLFLSRQGLKQTLATLVVTEVAVARNYLRQPNRKEWTPAERALGGPPEK